MTSKKPGIEELRIDRPASAAGGSSSALWIILVMALLLAVGAGWWWHSKSGGVIVDTVLVRAVAGASGGGTILNASGYVTARRAATVSSKVTGKVVEVLIEEGMKVSEGQILARLDSQNIQAGLNLAEAQLAAARAGMQETMVRMAEANRERKRLGDLVTHGIASQADLDRAEAESQSLEARLKQQQAEVTVQERQVATWQQQIEDTVITAPFGGIVTSKNAQPGEMISPISAGGGFTRTGICTIVDMESLEIEIDVNESYINRVSPGQQVEAALDAYPDWKIPCHVIAIIPTADRQKSTVRVRIGFAALDSRILPEMSVKVAFRRGESDGAGNGGGVLVPKQAVGEEQGKSKVLVVANNTIERRAVQVSGGSGVDAVVSAGLSPGERVVRAWDGGLREGAKVRQKSAEQQVQ